MTKETTPAPVGITVEQLSKNIQAARQQEAKHRDDAAACAGAAQAYEQLLTGLIQAQREAKRVDLLKAVADEELAKLKPAKKKK